MKVNLSREPLPAGRDSHCCKGNAPEVRCSKAETGNIKEKVQQKTKVSPAYLFWMNQ